MQFGLAEANGCTANTVYGDCCVIGTLGVGPEKREHVPDFLGYFLSFFSCCIACANEWCQRAPPIATIIFPITCNKIKKVSRNSARGVTDAI